MIKLSFNKTKWTGLLHIGPTFSFFRLLFEYWISGPKSYLDFRETRHRPAIVKNRERSIMGRMLSARLQRRELFEPCVVKIKIAARCFAQIPCFLHDVAFSVLNQKLNPAWFAIIGFTRHLVFKQAVIESLYS